MVYHVQAMKTAGVVIVSPIMAGIFIPRSVRVYSSEGGTGTSLNSRSMFGVLYHVACSLTRPTQQSTWYNTPNMDLLFSEVPVPPSLL